MQTRFAGVSLAVLLLRMVTVVSWLAISALAARLMQPEQVAVYFLALSAAAFGSLVAQAGLPGLALREIGRLRAAGEPHHALLQAMFAAALASCAVVFLIAAALASVAAAGLPFPAGFTAGMVALSGAYAATLAAQSFATETLRAKDRVLSATVYSGPLAAMATAIVLAAFAAAGVQAGVTEILAVTVAASLANTAWAARHLPLPGRSHFREWGSWAGRSRHFTLNQLSTFVFLQADLWVAAAVLDLRDVAVYAAATRLVQPLAFPIEAVEAPLAPLIARLLAKEERGELQAALKYAARMQTAVLLLAVVLLVAGGSWLLARLFGVDYAAGAPVAVILGMGWLARAAMGAYGQALMLSAHAPTMARLTFGCALLCIPAEWIGGRVWGLAGVATGAAVMLGAFSVLGAQLAAVRLGVDTTALPRARGAVHE